MWVTQYKNGCPLCHLHHLWPTSNCGGDVAMCGFRSPNNPLTSICPTMCFYPYVPPLISPLPPFLYYASAIFSTFPSLYLSIYIYIYIYIYICSCTEMYFYIFLYTVFFSQNSYLLTNKINGYSTWGRSSLTGLCGGRVWT